MTHVATIVAIALFTVGLWAFGVIAVAKRIVAASRSAVAIIRDREVDDDFKEREIQRASLTLLRDFLSILLRGIAAIGLSLFPLLAFDLAGLIPLGESVDALASWEAIAIATIALLAAFALKKMRR